MNSNNIVIIAFVSPYVRNIPSNIHENKVENTIQEAYTQLTMQNLAINLLLIYGIQIFKNVLLFLYMIIITPKRNIVSSMLPMKQSSKNHRNELNPNDPLDYNKIYNTSFDDEEDEEEEDNNMYFENNMTQTQTRLRGQSTSNNNYNNNNNNNNESETLGQTNGQTENKRLSKSMHSDSFKYQEEMIIRTKDTINDTQAMNKMKGLDKYGAKRDYMLKSYNIDIKLIELYNNLIINLSYIILFSCLLSLILLLCFIIILLIYRLNALSLLHIYKRQYSSIVVNNIGIWSNVANLIVTIGIITNAGLLVFTMHTFHFISLKYRLWILIGFVIVMFMLRYIITIWIASKPKIIKIQEKRNEFYVKRIIEKIPDADYDPTSIL